MPIVSLVVAMDRNRLIGRDNGLPWHLPADLKHFKAVTMGKPIVMGRKTFESIGRPLPGRRNVVISRNPAYRALGCEVFIGLEEALAALEDVEEVAVIGGAEIFKQAMPRADKMHLTVIDETFEGDAWFPPYDENEWRCTATETHRHEDESGSFTYRFLTLERGK
ncbi:MAG TPA: dihydrofolate reductase [Gammaproteobacteria bacterium]